MKAFAVCATLALALAASGCGRAPSRLLRQGQLPVADFPLYLTEGAPGNVWKYQSDGTRSLLANGLSDPRGVATDRFNHLFVVERGGNRLLQIDTTSGAVTVAATNLQSPSVVAVNSIGEVFVAQDGTMNVIRASDSKVFGSYSARPSALAFGAGDRMIVGLFDTDTVYWGADTSATSVSVTQPVNAALDATGRVYVAEGSASGARVWRYHQDSPGTGEKVADTLEGPQGIAVDPAENIYLVEQGKGRIVLVTYGGQIYSWASGLIDPQYLAFTQY